MTGSLIRYSACYSCVTIFSFSAFPVVAQQPAQPKQAAAPAAAGAQSGTDAAQAKAAFDQAFDKYKIALREIEQLRIKYQTADEAGRKKINAELTGHLANAQSLVNALTEAALAAYRAAPNTDPQITDLLTAVARYDVIGRPVEGEGDRVEGGDQFERALPILQALADGGNADRDTLLCGFVAAFATNNYDLAEKFLKQVQDAKPVDDKAAENDPTHKNLMRLVTVFAQIFDEYRKLWEKESAIRAAEVKADNLPRVKFTTTKGEITLELFENEAPQAVANFLTLVKQGFYTGSPFHRVLPAFMAQGGAKTNDGQGGPGYTIRCECYEPDARMHFRGSLSMAHAGRDTGNSQFFLTFVPTPHLNGKHTVFGRVIDGMEVLGDIQRRDPTQPNQPMPDKILKAEVIRDRGHEYKFDKLPER